MSVRLGVNIDHVATVRNARGGAHPDPVRAAKLVAEAGADGITFHLREDRRHIRDADLPAIAAASGLPLNLEMAAVDEMLDIALDFRPHAVCLVPERREERTTEGGLDVVGGHNRLSPVVRALDDADIRVSLFIEPRPAQIDAAADLGAKVVEFHTGRYCHLHDVGDLEAAGEELDALARGALRAHQAGLEVHMGHGLSYDTVKPVAAIAEVAELNIGHFLIGEALFVGLGAAISQMRTLIEDVRGEPQGVILGTGIDLIDIRRVEKTLERYGDRFINRIFTDTERAKAERRLRRADTYAKRFAAKEACAKALGTGVPRRGVHWRHMGVVNLPTGQPTFDLTGGAAKRLAELTPEGMKAFVHLTITDDYPLAQAFVMITAEPMSPS